MPKLIEIRIHDVLYECHVIVMGHSTPVGITLYLISHLSKSYMLLIVPDWF